MMVLCTSSKPSSMFQYYACYNSDQLYQETYASLYPTEHNPYYRVTPYPPLLCPTLSVLLRILNPSHLSIMSINPIVYHQDISNRSCVGLSNHTSIKLSKIGSTTLPPPPNIELEPFAPPIIHPLIPTITLTSQSSMTTVQSTINIILCYLIPIIQITLLNKHSVIIVYSKSQLSMFSRFNRTHNSHSSYNTQNTQGHTESIHNENEDYGNRIPTITFKNSINKGASTDRLASSITSEYVHEHPQLLKTSLSGSNLYEGMHMLAKSQEGGFMRSSQEYNMGSSISFASMRLAMKNSGSQGALAVDRRLKNEVLDDFIKNSVRGTQMTSSVRVNEIMCYSNDGKRAKYRLLDSSETHNAFYCSKCAINLVQEGYQVEEINAPKVDMAKRRQECQDLVRKLEGSENYLREELMRLEGERFNRALEERLNKVEEIYDIIILIIQQMKAKDSETTRRSVEQAQRVKNSEIVALRDQIERISETKRYIQGTMNHALKQLPDPQYRSVLQHHSLPLHEVDSYKPLTLMVKQDPVQKILETIFGEIGDHFHNMRIGGNMSRISSDVIEEQSNDFTLSDLKQKPFRNLFADEDVSFNR